MEHRTGNTKGHETKGHEQAKNPQQGRSASFVASMSTVTGARVHVLLAQPLLVGHLDWLLDPPCWCGRIAVEIVATHLGRALHDLRSNPLHSDKQRKSHGTLTNEQPRLPRMINPGP